MTDYKTARTAMVDCQVRPSNVTKYPIIDALLSTPRELYVPTEKRSIAYVGEHVFLTDNRVMLDARTFAKMLDAVNIKSDEMVLDIGCGYGYSSAILAKMAEAVVAVENDEMLANEASEILNQQSIDNVFVVHGELADGNKKNGPYDVIILQGAVEEVPSQITDQLKENGRICALFQNNNLGQCRIGYKSNNAISWRTFFDGSAPLLQGFTKAAEFDFA